MTRDLQSPRISPKLLRWLGFALILLPIAVACVIAYRTALNLPAFDDYDAILSFLTEYVAKPTASGRLWKVLTEQSIQYKLIFLHAIVVLEYQVTGSVNFRFLSYLGDAFMLFVPVLYWIMLRRSGRSLDERIWLFVPVSLLLFSLQYTETINWTMAALQNLTVLPFALAAFLLLTRPGRLSFPLACVSMALSIACSGNGFFVAATGMVLLLLVRSYSRLAIWTATLACMTWLYFTQYFWSPIAPPPPWKPLVKALVLIPFDFLGSAAGEVWLAVLLGTAMLVLFAVLVRKGWHRIDPASFAVALFCIITAIGVSGIRHQFGFRIGTSGRYRIYSLLMMASLYLGVLRLYAPNPIARSRRWGQALLAFGVGTVVFCAMSDYSGARELIDRKNLLVAHLILWERAPSPKAVVLVPDENEITHTPTWDAIRARFPLVLEEAMRTGRYHLVDIPASTPLPLDPHSIDTEHLKRLHPEVFAPDYH